MFYRVFVVFCCAIHRFAVLFASRSRTRAAVKANGGRIPLSFDYIVAAEHRREGDSDLPSEPAAEAAETADGTEKV